jgi:hypothetical protein
MIAGFLARVTRAWINKAEDGLRFRPTHALPFDEHGDLVSTFA